MNQVALYWPNDDHAHLRYHGYESISDIMVMNTLPQITFLPVWKHIREYGSRNGKSPF